MPTGYTAGIEDGMEFKEFALSCAKAFGACVTMREDPQDKPIPLFKEEPYYKERYEKAVKELAKYEKMTLDEANKLLEKEYKEEVKSNTEYSDNKRKLHDKYVKVYKEVLRWEPPTDEHVGLRNFMMNQIKESIRFDCGNYEPDVVIKKNAQQWLYDKIEECEKEVSYCMEKWKEETKRVADRNLWVKQLKESLRGIE